MQHDKALRSVGSADDQNRQFLAKPNESDLVVSEMMVSTGKHLLCRITLTPVTLLR